MTTLLEINQARKVFNKRTPDAFAALDDLSLTVEKGDFITIVGGNGAGKSTLLNAIAGTFLLDSGAITLNDKDISRLAEEDRAKFVSRVFQRLFQPSYRLFRNPEMYPVYDIYAYPSKSSHKSLLPICFSGFHQTSCLPAFVPLSFHTASR